MVKTDNEVKARSLWKMDLTLQRTTGISNAVDNCAFQMKASAKLPKNLKQTSFQIKRPKDRLQG